MNKIISTNAPFIHKYQPTYFKDFEQLDPTTITLMQSLISLNNLNVLIIGESGTGKTSIINSIIKEYYGNDYNYDNVLVLNSLKEQGIQYYRNDVKIFCQTCSLIKDKKKIVLLDDIDLINEQSQQVFRNCMDKYKHNIHVDMEIVHKLCTNIGYTIFDNYTNCVLNKKLTDGIKILYNLHDEGYSVMDILDNYFLYIKLTTLLNDGIKYKLTTLVCKYIIYFHNVHEDELELALFTNNFMQLFS